MPNRYVREGWLDSDRIRALGDAGEVMLLRLLLVADDFATFDGRLTVIQRRCWPAGDDEPGLPAPTVEEIERRLAALEAKSLIFRYEVEGKPYLFIPNFQQRTRAKAPKYPLPKSMTGTRQTHDGQASGMWRTPDGHMPDEPPTHVGAPQAVSGSSSSSGLPTTTTVSRNDSKPPPVDKSARKVQGGLTTSTPARPQPPVVTGTGDLRPPAALTPEEREAQGVAAPPAELLERYTRRPNGEPPPTPASPKLNGRRHLEREAPPEGEPSDDELLQQIRHPVTVAAAAKALDSTLPTDQAWKSNPDSIDRAGATLGMQRLPFEEDDQFAQRIEARIALG